MKIKNYLVALYVLFLPVLLFLDVSNLRQISGKSIIIIILTLIIFFFIILIFYKIFQFIFKLPFESNLLPGLSFIFYLQFYYAEIRELLGNNLNNAGYYIIIFLILLSFGVIILWSKHFKILNKFVTIFSILVTITFAYNFYIFSSLNTKHHQVKEIKTNKNLVSINKQKKFNNVYFIIFDSMMPMEIFKKDTIFNKEFNFDIDSIKSKFNSDFKYINGSASNYSNTKLSISSIFYNEYFIDTKSEKFKNYNNFYPYFFYNQNKINKLNLLNILKENEVKFTWFSNSSMPCKNIIGITCGSSSDFETDILNEVKIFYAKTPIFVILNKLTSSLDNDIPSDDFLNYIKDKNKIKNKNNFIFIHNMIPNVGAASLDYNCNLIERSKISYEERYLCSIKKITELTELISNYDKDALVIITADHGIKSFMLKEENRFAEGMVDNDALHYDPRIFTLIKFPKNCSNIAPKNYDTLNLVRYLLNCNYTLNLDYLPYSHFRAYGESSINFGKVIDITKNMKKYLNKVN